MTFLDDPIAIIAIFAALSFGGILKGATGAGAPVVAVPVIAAFFDVRLAVAIMSVVNLITNTQQIWQYRSEMIERKFTRDLVVGSAVGTVMGTFLLVSLSEKALGLLISGVVIAYILLRIVSPSFRLSQERASRIALPMAFAAGAMQGSTGISAPITVSFLNAMRIARPAFIFTVSAFFLGMAVPQVPLLFAVGVLTWEIALLGVLALIPMGIFMGVGGFLAKRLSPEAFDRIILVFLALLALRLIQTSLFQ